MRRHAPLPRPSGPRRTLYVLAALPLLIGGAAMATDPPPAAGLQKDGSKMTGTVRIGYLHHSTGEIVYGQGGVADFIQQWNAAHGTDYRITEQTYPSTSAGYARWLGQRIGVRIGRRLGDWYPWANYPYDYWNLWVKHTGSARDRGEDNLDDLVKKYDVIVFKHCFPVSAVKPDEGTPSVSSEKKTIANYRLQYQALKERLRQFPAKRFIVWTGPPLVPATSNVEDATRAREFFQWVKESWDEKGDNIFVWDYRAIAADDGLFAKPGFARDADDPHPSQALSRAAGPAIGQRIVDVIEGRGDTGSITGMVLTAGK